MIEATEAKIICFALLFQCDPYIKISMGRKTLDDRDDYKPNTLNPEFGRWDSNVSSSLNLLNILLSLTHLSLCRNIK